MKILIVKMSSMGDILHTLPALTEAQQMIPDIKFDWVVEEAFAEIPAWHTSVNRVIPIAWRRWRKKLFTFWLTPEWQDFTALMRTQKYDYIIDAQGLIKSAFVSRIAKGVRCGFDRKSIREPLASLAYHKTFSINKTQHAINRVRQLLAATLNYSLSEAQINYGIDHNIASCDISLPLSYSVFIANTSQVRKRWPLTQWRALLNKMQATNQTVIIPGGYANERSYIEQIAAGFDNVIILPSSTLAQIRTVLAHSQAIISVDTGLAHLAAALNKPTITLYGPTDIDLIGTAGQQQIHLTSNTMQLDISAKRVWQVAFGDLV